MPFQKKLAFEALMQRERIKTADLPDWLQAALRLFYQDYKAAGTLTPELAAQAQELQDDIREWHDDAPDDAPPTPVLAPDPVFALPPTKEGILAQLYAAGRTKLAMSDLLAAGFQANPGPWGARYGAYQLEKSMFASAYTLTKRG